MCVSSLDPTLIPSFPPVSVSVSVMGSCIINPYLPLPLIPTRDAPVDDASRSPDRKLLLREEYNRTTRPLSRAVSAVAPGQCRACGLIHNGESHLVHDSKASNPHALPELTSQSFGATPSTPPPPLKCACRYAYDASGQRAIGALYCAHKEGRQGLQVSS